MRYILISFLFFITNSLFAQVNNEVNNPINNEIDTVKLAVLQLFEDTTKVDFVKHFRGQFNHVTDITMTLGCEGEYCQGQFTYVRSGVTFKLRGTLKGIHLRLDEFDDNNALSATLKGLYKKEEKSLKLDWTNALAHAGGSMALTEVESLPTVAEYCAKDKWVHRYDGRIDGEEVILLLDQKDPTRMDGAILFKTMETTYQISGEAKDGKLDITFKDADYDKKGSIVGNLLKDKLVGVMTNEEEDKFQINLRFSNELLVGCMAYTDYVTNFDYTYPRSYNRAFNLYMSSKIDSFYQDCQQFVDTSSLNVPIPENRFKLRSYVWYDIDYLSDKIISGYIVKQATWNSQETEAFNFDLTKNRAITPKALFKKGAKWKQFARKYLKANPPSKDMAEYQEYQDIVNNEQLNIITIHEHGIEFSTEFSGLFGAIGVVIPYSELRPMLKRRSPISHLVR